MPERSPTIDTYLATLNTEQAVALEELRRSVRAVVPDAEEFFSYGLPAFRLQGRPLVAFGAAAKHCALYPMSSSIVEEFKDDLEGFDTSKGTIRFQPGAPIPESLIRRIVEARIAENSKR